MDDTKMPRLRPVLAVLVCGHRQERLGAHAEDPELRAALQATLRGVLDDAIASATAAFTRAPGHYEKAGRDAPVLRVLTGGMDGADALAEDVVLGMAATEHVVVGSRARAAMPAGQTASAQIGFAVPHTKAGRTHVESLAQESRDALALAHADVVVALWDGKPARGSRGGTVRLVHAAAQLRKPVIWIEVRPSDPAHTVHIICRSTLQDRQLAALMGPEDPAEGIRACFCPYSAARLATELDLQLTPWAVLRSEADGGDAQTDLLDVFGIELAAEGSLDWAAALDEMLWSAIGFQWARVRRALDRFLHGAPFASAESDEDPLYRWADDMARAAAARHRLATWCINLAAVLAVFLAVWGADVDAHGAFAVVLSVAELACLAGIGLLVRHRSPRRWHRRWLLCRVVAEEMRVHGMVERVLGIAPAALRCPWRPVGEGLALEDAASWLVHRWLVGAGFLPEGRELTPGGGVHAQTVINGQVAWMEGRSAALKEQEENMEGLAVLLLAGALLAVLAHLWWHGSFGILFFTAVLPALGAAISNILKLTEVHRIRKGYARTAQRLRDLLLAMGDQVAKREAATTPEQQWRHMMQVRRLAIEAGHVLAEENHAWRDLMVLHVPAPP